MPKPRSPTGDDSREDRHTPTAPDATSGVSRRAVLGGGIGAGAALLAQEEDETSEENGDEETTEENGAEGGSVTAELVDYAYEPGTESPLVISPGTTVQFVWITDTHNINVDSQPSEAGWEGHEPVEDAGFEYEHTFEVAGEYEFHCDPHLNLGMEGTIRVEEGTTSGGGDGGGGAIRPYVPDEAMTLAVGSITALVFVTFMAYFFMKYGGEYEREM
ncbi:plastocyanin/azurin family copper-binding protein [Natronoarchaeum sp. GCM10025703]|uniref:plastocyanin/azurin family copper-binding protein n=1 Tax=unclassified Natronoarchaeum TaxID=2620183 RepID=UPI0036149D4F